jgi:hypothetical protein
MNRDGNSFRDVGKVRERERERERERQGEEGKIGTIEQRYKICILKILYVKVYRMLKNKRILKYLEIF